MEFYSITESQTKEFEQNGHILLRGVAESKEIVRFGPAICAAANKYSTETRNIEDRDAYGKAFLQITNLWRHDEETKRFVFEPRFAQMAADLLGVKKVRLYHDQALLRSRAAA